MANRRPLAIFVGSVLTLICAHALLRTLAQVALPLLALVAPAVILVRMDRFGGLPSTGALANFAAVVAAAGALLFMPTIAIIGSTCLIAIGIAWLASTRSLHRFSYERRLTSDRLFPGDEMVLEIAVHNHKLFPLSWFQVADPVHVRGGTGKHHLHRLLDIDAPVELLEQQLAAIVVRGAVGPYQRVTTAIKIRALHRGTYALGPARLASGDPFGLFKRTATHDSAIEFVVYPRRMHTDRIDPAFWTTMGNWAARRSLFTDPTLLAGSREFRPDDSLRHVDWKATARSGEMQVRIHDPSTTTHIMILLNLHTFARAWQGVDPDRMEAAIEAAASIATQSLDQGLQVGLSSNGVISDVERPTRIPPSASPLQAALILDHLARLSYWGGHSAETLLLQEVERRGSQTSLVFVTPLLTPGIIDALRSPRVRNRVCVVYCGRHAAPTIRDVPVYLVLPSGDDLVDEGSSHAAS